MEVHHVWRIRLLMLISLGLQPEHGEILGSVFNTRNLLLLFGPQDLILIDLVTCIHHRGPADAPRTEAQASLER